MLFSSVPIQYISSGIKIDPDDRITPLMKIIGAPSANIQFELISYFGAFDIVSSVPVEDLGERNGPVFTKFTMAEKTVQEVNHILSSFVYTVRIYDAKPIIDYVKLRTWGDINAEVNYPIEIVRKPMPVMTFRENDRLIDKVTIVTKVR